MAVFSKRFSLRTCRVDGKDASLFREGGPTMPRGRPINASHGKRVAVRRGLAAVCGLLLSLILGAATAFASDPNGCVDAYNGITYLNDFKLSDPGASLYYAVVQTSDQADIPWAYGTGGGGLHGAYYSTQGAKGNISTDGYALLLDQPHEHILEYLTAIEHPYVDGVTHCIQANGC